MILYGNGGHAKVIRDCLKKLEIEVSAIFDDNSTGLYDPLTLPDTPLLIAIGDNAARQAVASKVKHPFGQVIHPSAQVSESATVGEGTVVFHNAVIQAATYIGRHCILNTACVVEHDCQMGDFVHIAPNATVCGNVSIGEGTLIGAGAVVLPNLNIGKRAVIGAGCTIRKDVPDFAVVV